MNIKTISEEIHANARLKGFWDETRNVGELLMLCVSELSEALEADRKKRYSIGTSSSVFHPEFPDEMFADEFKAHVKDTFQDEIADTVIRLFDLCEGLDIDLESHIAAKLRYNRTREHMHGKAY